MSEPIKEGDWVMVVRGMPCCGHLTKRTGSIFTVTGLLENSGSPCGTCGARVKDIDPTVVAGLDLYVQLSRLKRIPPLSELDDVKKDEEIHA